jgi:hypothetical protein
MGFAGYISVCMQLYCRGKLSLFHTTCFGIYGHLQVCRILLLSCSWKNLLRCFFFFLYLARGYAFVRFHMCFPVLFSRFISCFLCACLSACLFVLFVSYCKSYSILCENVSSPCCAWIYFLLPLKCKLPLQHPYNVISRGSNIPSIYWNVLILWYRVSTIKRPDFEDVLEISSFLFKC